MKDRLNEYIKENIKSRPRIRSRLSSYQTLRANDYLKESNKESNFQELLFKYIDDRNLKEYILIEDYFPKLEMILIIIQVKKLLYY